MAFYSGQKIVCIDDNWFPLDEVPMVTLPKANQTYTFRQYHPHNGSYLVLFEISIPHSFYKEVGFRTTNFRPLVEKKTDISIFTKILQPDKVNA